MRAIHVANIPNARVYYILDGEEGGNDGAVVPPNQDPMFVNFWSFAERKRHLKPVTNTKFHKFFWDGHKGDEADRWNNMFLERLIKPDAEMLSSVPIVTKFPNIKKERNNARSNHASEFKSLTGAGHHEKALGRRGRGLGRGIGRVGRGAASVFDPKAWDGDGDGIVQERTPYERPAIPGINTNLPGVPHTRTKPADYPDDHRDPIGERPPAPQEKPDISRMRRFKPEGAVGEHPSLIPMPGRRAERMARRTEPSPRRQGLRSSIDPHGPPGTGSDRDPRGGTYPPPKPFDVWRLNPKTKHLIRNIDERIARARGPEYYEKAMKRTRDRVDKELNDGQPIKTIADATRVMGAVNSSFLPSPNGESPRSEATFLGARELIERFPHGTGVYKLGDVKFRDDDEELDEQDRNMMYAWLANSLQTGRYDLVHWALVSKTEHDRRADHRVPGYGHNEALGMVQYESATDMAWRLEERGPVEGELAELMGDEDAPIFTASTVSQETLKESLGWIKPSGSGYVLNEGAIDHRHKAKDKPRLRVMYASEPEIVNNPTTGLPMEFVPSEAIANGDPEFAKAMALGLLHPVNDGRTDPAPVPVGVAPRPLLVKAYGVPHAMVPKTILDKMENVAVTQFAATMKTLEDNANRTAEEIATKGTDQAIAPGNGGRYTKRFMRVYARARAIMHDSVNQHELGHANHYLAMLEDVAKRAKALAGRTINFQALSEYMTTKRHAAMTGRQKRRLLDHAALQATSDAGRTFDLDMFNAQTRIGKQQHMAEELLTHPQYGPSHPITIDAVQKWRGFVDQYQDALDQPILDHNGAEIRRTPEISKLLKQAKRLVETKGGKVTFDYAPGDAGTPMTRGDLFFLFGPSNLLLNMTADPDGNPVVRAIYSSPFIFLEERDNKKGQPGTHEPWGMLNDIMDSSVVSNGRPNGIGRFVPADDVAAGDPVEIHTISPEAVERMHEAGLPGYEDRNGNYPAIDAIDTDTVKRLLLARGRVAGLVANPGRSAGSMDDAEATMAVAPDGPLKLHSQSDMSTEDLLRTLLPSEIKRSLSDREVDDLSEKQVAASIHRTMGTGDHSLIDILKVKQVLSDTNPSVAEANALLREASARTERDEWPLNVVIDGLPILSGETVLGDTNPATGQMWAAGDELDLPTVTKLVQMKNRRAQNHISAAFETHALMTEFYDALDEDEVDALVDIVRGFGGIRYTPYMGKRYPNASAAIYATDATRQEIMSELTALAFAGEKIMIEVEKINDKGELVKEFVELSKAQKAIIEKLMKWMKPKAQWGPKDA